MGRTPLSMTDRRRLSLFNPQAVVAVRSKVQRISSKQKLLEAMAKGGGMNLRMAQKAMGDMDLIERRRLKRGWDPQRILIEQAIHIDNIASEAADHVVMRYKHDGNLLENAKREGIEVEKMNPVMVERAFWEFAFDKFLGYLEKKPRIGDKMRVILAARDRVKLFTSVPEIVHKQRAKHWKTIQIVEANLLSKHVDPQTNITKETGRVLGRYKSGKNPNTKRANSLAAQDLVVAASVYADLLLEQKGKSIEDTGERGRFWNHAYSAAMEQIYPLIAEDAGLINEIFALHNAPPLKLPKLN